MADQRIDLPGEVWKPVVGHEGLYEVSSLGRLWSVYRGHYLTGRILKPRLNKNGYLDVQLKVDGRNVHRTVHTIVAEAFLGPRPPLHQAAHLNGSGNDPRASNLAWVTPKENHAHKKLHGTQTGGFNHTASKLTPGDVLEIRRRFAAGESSSHIARSLPVSKQTVLLTAVGDLHGDFRPDTIVPRLGKGVRRRELRYDLDGGHRGIVWVELDGETIPFAAACKRRGLIAQTVRERLARGWPKEDAFMPVGHRPSP